MISAIAPAGAESSEKGGGEAQNPDAISNNPPNLTSGDVVGVRERVPRSTLKLIADGGVAAVTNRRVATAAGVSLGSLTYHFAKPSYYARACNRMSRRRPQDANRSRKSWRGRNQVCNRSPEAVEQLVAVPSEIPRQIAELELHLQAARDPELRTASRRWFEAHEQIASAALNMLGIPDGMRQAPVVVALMTGLAVRRLAEGGEDAQGTSEALLALVRRLSAE